MHPVLGEIVLRDPEAGHWLRFDEPVDVLACRDPAAVPDVLVEVEHRVHHEGFFAAGFLTYEAARGFDPAYRTRPGARLPLVCFGLFRNAGPVRTLPRPGPQPVPEWRMAESRQEYFRKVAAIKDRIRAGDTYQINYTTRQVAEQVDDPHALFQQVAADAPYAAFVDCGDHAIVCASPELFFRLDRNRLRCQPMKGTAKRGMTLGEDRELAAWLYRSGKNRAENVMIADMVRNDLGRVAVPGSVSTPELFSVTRHPTVWQMTSTVEARTDAPVSEVIRALFPSASVTGAPKVSSMRIIESLEPFPREIYTGAIGYLAPNRKAQFNVAIRTAVVDRRTGSAFYGVGGGIVADSEPGDEFAECLAKARILSSPAPASDFSLLETMLWTPERGIFLVDHHLKRLADSAEYFGFTFDRNTVGQALDSLTGALDERAYRIRLSLTREGTPSLEYLPISESGSAGKTPPLVGLATHPIDPENPFLYHKTSRREVYERASASAAGCDDVLLWNPDGYLTETTIANIVVELDGARYTPPVTCGLLGGTYRQWLLERGKVRERPIHKDELARVRGLTLINSVRGEVQARLRGYPEAAGCRPLATVTGTGVPAAGAPSAAGPGTPSATVHGAPGAAAAGATAPGAPGTTVSRSRSATAPRAPA